MAIKKILLGFVAFLCVNLTSTTAQNPSNIQQPLSINEDGSTPDTTAILDIQSESRGVLIPRLTSAQRTDIMDPANGLLVYDTNTGSFWYYRNSEWVNLSALSDAISDADGDTRVETEASADEDLVRVTAADQLILLVGEDTILLDGNVRILGSVITGSSGNTASTITGVIAGGQGNHIDADVGFIGAGSNDTLTGINAFIAGGSDNNALEEETFIGGGYGNTANGRQSAILGGNTNSTSSFNAMVIGGNTNAAVGTNAFAGGGNNNTAVGINSFIAGGFFNSATATSAFVAGGSTNHALFNNSSVVGGKNNTALASGSFIGGGQADTASGSQSFIAAGSSNTVLASDAFIGAGSSNIISSSGLASSIGGGQSNTINAAQSFIGGGSLNSTSGLFSFMGGGSTNMVTNSGASITGGFLNKASGSASAGLGGTSNHAAGDLSVIAGGNSNQTLGTGAFIGGGVKDTASGAFSFIGSGTGLVARSYGEAVFGTFNEDYMPDSINSFDSTDRVFVIGSGADSINRHNAMTVLKNGNVGFGVSNPNFPIQMASGANVDENGDWNSVSDMRLKEDIGPLTYGLEEVMRINAVNYRMKTGSENQIGFIAQELREIVPEVVSGIEGDIEKGETLGVAYGKLTALLVKGMQEQQALIEAQERKLGDLAGENDELKQRLARIEAALFLEKDQASVDD